MPFDAAPVVRSPLPDSVAGQSALVLDMMESYFRDGERWAQGNWRQAGDKRCLLGAARFVRSEIRCERDDRAERYLARVIEAEQTIDDPYMRRKRVSIELIRDAIVMKYNDTKGRTYSDIAALLCKAKELAEADASAWERDLENECASRAGALSEAIERCPILASVR